jgi:hypothetical protein
VAGAGWANSSDVSPDSGRGGQGSVLRVTGARFRGLDGDEAAPAVGRTGSQWRRPPRLAMPETRTSGCGCWGRRAAVELEEALRILRALEFLEERLRRGELPGGRCGRRRPQARAGRTTL